MAAFGDLTKLQTEQINPNSSDIDQVSTAELCQIINNEDATIAKAVSKCIPVIAEALDCLAARVRAGGRVIYVGAGTSGRLGVLDASEIPPTFSSPEGQFVGIIAGGEAAIRYAQEGAEDNVKVAIRDLETLRLNSLVDSLVGIAASGRTPYVLSCLSYARSLGCVTIGVACTEPSAMGISGDVDFMISPVVGAEVITGSTRMKAGTATKLVLNMLSTGTMVRIGKTYGNMMVDLKATNLKLQQRSRNILRTICGPRCPDSDDDLDALLKSCHGSVKLAIATLTLGMAVPDAKQRLDEAGGILANIFMKPTDTIVDATTGDCGGQKYVLCVDGGGSKCAATVLSADGQKGYGEASDCNVTDSGIEAATSSISAAIQRACDTHPNLRCKPWRSSLFSSIWIALAGYDRKVAAIAVNHAMEMLFKKSLGTEVKITNDIELLATSQAEKNGSVSVVVLVAGTGSVAMSFKRQGDQFNRVGRSGGWGHLLGDDGSGFDIGRRGIRVAMAALDEFKNVARRSKGDAVFQPTSLVKRILEHFRPTGTETLHFDLLSALLSSSSELEKKKRIAQAARLVIESSEVDPEAKTIVDTAVRVLVQLLDPITSSGQIDPAASTLILAGGLMQSKVFSGTLKNALNEAGKVFKHVEAVDHPAILGAEYLLRKRQG